MTEIEQMQTIVIIGVLSATAMILFGIHKMSQGLREGKMLTYVMGLCIILFSLPVSVLTLKIKNWQKETEVRSQEIQTIEDTLPTGTLYYNGNEISNNSMTPE